MSSPSRRSRRSSEPLALLLALTLALASIVTPADAQTTGSRIVSSSGAVHALDEPPRSVVLNELTSDDALFVFAEQRGVTLDASVAADILEPGVYFDDATPEAERTAEQLPSGRVPAGTRVDSYYFHFDNASYEFRLLDYFGCVDQIGVSGTVTFDRPVVGLVLASWKLNRSNDDVGLPTVAYDTATFRHFPGVNITNGCRSDQISLSPDRRTLTLRNFTDIHHDNYRVLVDAG